MSARQLLGIPQRKLVGQSHEAKYSYWTDPDGYVYQRHGLDGDWIGWLCALPVWESVFSKATWMHLWRGVDTLC